MFEKLIKRILITVFAIAFIIYCIVQASIVFSASMTTNNAELTTLERKTDAVSYIVRDEIVIDSPNENGVYDYVIGEGEKLSLNQPVANIYSNNGDLKIQDRIKEIDDRITVLKNSTVDKRYLRTSVSKIDKTIDNNIINYYENSLKGDFSVTVQNENDFLTLLNKRFLVVRANFGFNEEIEALQNKRNDLVNSLSNVVATVNSPSAGYFYSEIDGYEGLLNTSMLKNISVEDFLKIVNSKVTPENGLIGKVVTGFYWYSVCLVKKEEAAFYNSGEYYSIFFPYSNGNSIRAKLEGKITENDGDDALLLFTTNSIPENFNFTRKQAVEIVRVDYTGLKVEKDALRIVDGYEGVYVMSGNTVYFKRCNKLYENEGKYIVSQNDPLKGQNNKYSYLKIHDSVITGGKELYHGKVIS